MFLYKPNGKTSLDEPDLRSRNGRKRRRRRVRPYTSIRWSSGSYIP